MKPVVFIAVVVVALSGCNTDRAGEGTPGEGRSIVKVVPDPPDGKTPTQKKSIVKQPKPTQPEPKPTQPEPKPTQPEMPPEAGAAQAETTGKLPAPEIERTAEEIDPPLPDFAAVYEAISGSVVSIEAFSGYGGASSKGSGFFIDRKGHILSNAHLVHPGDRIEVVTRDERRLSARLVGLDRHTDLALLKVEGERLPAPLAFCEKPPEVGQWVLAVGNPLGLEFSATRGIVSATGRDQVSWDSAGYHDFIQTDAAINEGNSGGPMVDVEGRVLGICTAVSEKGNRIGFAIPAEMARVVTEHLLRHGRLVRAWLGIQLREFNGKLEVVSVLPGSPAARAGLRTGDWILKRDDSPVESLQSFRWRVATAEIGKKLRLTVMHAGSEKHLEVLLEEAPHRAGRRTR